MTTLYAENSAYAEAFILIDGKIPPEHSVVSDFRDSKRFNNSIAFYEQVINAESKLIGGRGNEFQIKKDRYLPMFFDSVERTKKDIEIGRQHFVPLPHGGGCMRKEGVCDLYGIDWTLPCLDCKNSTAGGDGGKALKAYAQNMTENMKDLDEDSLAYTTANEVLDRIKIKILEQEDV